MILVGWGEKRYLMETLNRIERLERRFKLVTSAFLAIIAIIVFAGWKAQSTSSEVLRVRQITIVDENGKERVWIGAPVPDPIVQGERRKRSSPVSGIILLDAKGNERSGYVTSDNYGEVFLSLDSEKAQETLFLVNPGGGHLSIYDAERNFARIGVLGGRPILLLKNKGETIFEQPSGTN